MRISDWSSDVCSSDLRRDDVDGAVLERDEAGKGKDRPGFQVEQREFVAHQPPAPLAQLRGQRRLRSEEHTSELQSLMRISYAVFCLKKKTYKDTNTMRYIF